MHFSVCLHVYLNVCVILEMISLGPTDNSSEIGQKYGLVFLGEWNANLYFFTAFSMRLLSLTKAQTAFSRFAQFWINLINLLLIAKIKDCFFRKQNVNLFFIVPKALAFIE